MTNDERSRSVFHVVLCPVVVYLLVLVRRLEQCNHATTAKARTDAMQAVEVPYTTVRALLCDNAAYNTKAVNAVLLPLMPGAYHAPCLTHIIAMVADEPKEVSPRLARGGCV